MDIILQNIPTFKMNDGIFCRTLSIPRNIVMNLNNVMKSNQRKPTFLVKLVCTWEPPHLLPLPQIAGTSPRASPPAPDWPESIFLLSLGLRHLPLYSKTQNHNRRLLLPSKFAAMCSTAQPVVTTSLHAPTLSLASSQIPSLLLLALCQANKCSSAPVAMANNNNNDRLSQLRNNDHSHLPGAFP